MVVSGLAILAKPIWLELLNVFLTELNFSIIGEFDWLVGLGVIVIALIYNTIHKYIDYKFEPVSKPAFKSANIKEFATFGELCQEILPILKDNEYIFKTTGPNSGKENEGPLRTDLTMWEKLRKESIKPNNESIKKIVVKNKQIIPSKHSEIFQRLVLHIDAFNQHIENPNFDYSEFQFPREIPDIIANNAFETAKNSKTLEKKVKWLNKRLNISKVDRWFIFGSTVFNPQKAKDLDVAILINEEAEDELNEIKFDFKVKHKMNLHLSVFDNEVESDFIEFSRKNPLKLEQENG
jgi:predicted nucleotidyltransferase